MVKAKGPRRRATAARMERVIAHLEDVARATAMAQAAAALPPGPGREAAMAMTDRIIDRLVRARL